MLLINCLNGKMWEQHQPPPPFLAAKLFYMDLKQQLKKCHRMGLLLQYCIVRLFKLLFSHLSLRLKYKSIHNVKINKYTFLFLFFITCFPLSFVLSILHTILMFLYKISKLLTPCLSVILLSTVLFLYHTSLSHKHLEL